MLILELLLVSIYVITPVLCYPGIPITLEDFSEKKTTNIMGILTFEMNKYQGNKERPVPYKVRGLTPIAKFIDEYFYENPGLNGTESLYKVFNMTYSVCNSTVINRDVSDRIRALCRKHFDDISDLIMVKYDRFLDSDNVDYNIQKEYLGYKLKNWGNVLEPLTFKNSFCNLPEEEDLEELNYQLIQVVCSIIKKNDTEFVKKLPLLTSEDDKTRIRWLRKADEAIHGMEKYFQRKLKSAEERLAEKGLNFIRNQKLFLTYFSKTMAAEMLFDAGMLNEETFTCLSEDEYQKIEL